MVYADLTRNLPCFTW